MTPGGDAGRRLSRRRLLEIGGGFAAGAAIGGGAAGASARDDDVAQNAEASYPFDGPHEQAGITTPRQRHLALAAFTLDDGLHGAFGRGELAGLMQDWSTAARALAAGQALPEGLGSSAGLGAPADTGEADGLGPSGLTITFGFGPEVFGTERDLVRAADRPGRLETLPRFAGDALEPRWSGGDLLVAASADDAQVAVHAIRNLARMARGAAGLHWLQRGFLPETAKAGEAPRNLMGFRDGQSMLDHRDQVSAGKFLWSGSDAPAWMRGGGTQLVVRRIRMQLEAWDTATLEHQEATVGRSKGDGVFLPGTAAGRGDDYDGSAVDPDGRGAEGSHATVARDAATATGQILRRPYSYADGVVEETGQLDAGLIFLAFQRSIPDQFIPMQERIARLDAMNEYTSPIGSAVFAVPPASRGPKDWVGSGLLG
ncbi:MAG: Dyp-type peroxidase [Solirubrobacteraceae bacterium]|nr:Dyp-type peroxidase [Solirubrobacteraceae bacterium]